MFIFCKCQLRQFPDLCALLILFFGYIITRADEEA